MTLTQILTSFPELSALATQTFGTSEVAFQWLSTPHPSLHHQAPVELLDDPQGYQKVYDLLIAIQYGFPP